MENRKKFKTIIIVSGLLIFALLSLGAVKYTSDTVFCNSCHEMNPAYAGWNYNIHQQIHCYECHTDEGFAAKLKVKANGLKEVYLHFTQEVNMDEVKSDVPEHRCIKCHDFTQKDKYSERVANFHTQHQGFKFDCITCHSGAGHSINMFDGFKNEGCKGCHQPKV